MPHYFTKIQRQWAVFIAITSVVLVSLGSKVEAEVAGSDVTNPSTIETLNRQKANRNPFERDFSYPIMARWISGIKDKLFQLETLKVDLFSQQTQAALADILLNRANSSQSTQYLSEGLYAMVGERGANQINNLMVALSQLFDPKTKQLSLKGMKSLVKAYNDYIKVLPAEALQDPNEAVAILWWFLHPTTRFGQVKTN